MTFHRETITDPMASIAKVMFVQLDEGYYLAGGTALALRLGHRKSVDLDYFIDKGIDTLHLKEKILELFPSNTRILFEEKNTLWCSIKGVKVSFISRFDSLLEPVEVVEDFRLAGLKDIAVMKLSAICGREEYKDYFDLACIAEHTDARSWISWWRTVYPQVDNTGFIVALAYVDAMRPVQLDIADRYKSTNVSDVLHAAVKTITDSFA